MYEYCICMCLCMCTKYIYIYHTHPNYSGTLSHFWNLISRDSRFWNCFQTDLVPSCAAKLCCPTVQKSKSNAFLFMNLGVLFQFSSGPPHYFEVQNYSAIILGLYVFQLVSILLSFSSGYASFHFWITVYIYIYVYIIYIILQDFLRAIPEANSKVGWSAGFSPNK